MVVRALRLVTLVVYAVHELGTLSLGLVVRLSGLRLNLDVDGGCLNPGRRSLRPGLLRHVLPVRALDARDGALGPDRRDLDHLLDAGTRVCEFPSVVNAFPHDT